MPIENQEMLPDTGGEKLEFSPKPTKFRRRSWKDYIFEFLLVFMAISLGYYVDNKRDEYGDQEHTREFARQLVEGLQRDTANLRLTIAFHNEKMQAFDSLYRIFSIPGMPPKKWAGIYRFLNLVEQRRKYNPTTTTFDQISHSGALRNFRNGNLVENLLEYKHWIDLINIQEELEVQYIEEQIIPFVSTHFERNLMPQRFHMHINRMGWDSTMVGKVTPQRFLNDHPDLLYELENIVIKARDFCFLPGTNKQLQLKRGIELIDLLKKEYQLD